MVDSSAADPLGLDRLVTAVRSVVVVVVLTSKLRPVVLHLGRSSLAPVAAVPALLLLFRVQSDWREISTAGEIVTSISINQSINPHQHYRDHQRGAAPPPAYYFCEREREK